MSIFTLAAELLFIGHSLIGPSLPGLVESSLRSRGHEARAQFQIINGAPLSWNWRHSATAQGVDGLALMADGRADVVVLTEAVPLANHLRWNDTEGFARQFYRAALAGNPAAQVFLYETWHDLRSGTGVDVEYDENDDIPWRTRLDEDLFAWRGVVDAVNASRPDGAPPMRLIPAGQAMARMADDIDAGLVEGLTGIGQLFTDDIHLNDRGQFLVAMVMHAAIAGEDPSGISPRIRRLWSSRDTVVTNAMAAHMQAVAWEVVQTEVAAETLRLAGGDVEVSPETRQASAETFAPVRNPSLGFELSGIADWSVQQPFVDVMKTARPWTGHLPGRWGGVGHDDLAAAGHLNEQGWPRSIPAGVSGLSTLILTDLPPETITAAGTYRLSYRGRGELRVEGRARVLSAVPGTVWFAFEPGEGAVVLTIAETDPSDPIREIAVVHERDLERHAAGELFNPMWLDRLRGVRLARFMGWMATNDSTVSGLGDRPRPGDYTYARNGVPIEVIVQAANALGADPWLSIPHLASDDLVRHYARTLRDGLAQGLVAHVEFSNEVWNWQFAQAHWADSIGKTRWGRDSTWVQAYAVRAAEIARIWAEEFGAEAGDRLVRVLSTHTGWIGLEHDILNAPLFVAEDPARNLPPYRSFDAYAVTGYFSAHLGSPLKAPVVRRWLEDSRVAAEQAASERGLAGSARDAHVARHRFDLAVTRAAAELRNGALTGQAENSLDHLLRVVLPHHAAVAQAHGLRLMMYEGGSHVTGSADVVEDEDLTAFFSHLNYTSEMGTLYTILLDGWAGLSDAPFLAFADVAKPGKWGSWGALRHLADDNPRWRALVAPPS